MATDKDTKWIRPLHKHEGLFEFANSMGFGMTVYQLSLASRKILEEKQVQTALSHLYRKVENFRLVIRPRDNEEDLWFCEMEEEKIDFKITNGADIAEEFEKMQSTPYDSCNGPLWRVVLQHEPEKPCHFPELQEEYPHQYTVLIGTHHSPTDGSSKNRQLGLFLRLLNDVIEDNPIDDAPYGFLSDRSETVDLTEKRELEFKENPELHESLKNEIEGIKSWKTHWEKIVGSSCGDSERRPLHITRTMNKEDSKIMRDRFKSVGVTLHSGFFSLMNVVLVDMMKEKDIIEEEYNIGIENAINMRRYWESPDKNLAFGNNMAFLRLNIKTPSDVKENIIPYMQTFHKDLHQFLDNKRPIDEDILFDILSDEEGNPIDIENLLIEIPPTNVYYNTSNMGDTTKLVGEHGDQVKLLWYTRSTSIHLSNTPVQIMMHSYLDQLIIGVDHSPCVIPTTMAEELIDRTLELCKSFSE